MKKAAALMAVVLTLGLAATSFDAEAKRLGGARNSGMQRSQVTQPATPPAGQPGAPANTATQGAPATAGAPAAAAAAGATAKRSWAGPLTALAAGLGLAALASYLGFGEALANMMLIALLAFAAFALIAFFLRKRAAANGGPAMAGAGAGTFRTGNFGGGAGGSSGTGTGSGLRIGSGLGQLPPATGQANPLPADFDAAGFARNAKAQFMALQDANDARDLDRLRDYLTPEMFNEARDEIATRTDAPQRTEVFGLEAQVLEVVEEQDRYIVSVRFTGSIREQGGAVPEDLDEVWHLTKPRAGFGGWVVAGIQQVERPA